MGIYINPIQYFYMYLAKIYRSNQIKYITPLNALSNLTKLTSLNINLGYLINHIQYYYMYLAKIYRSNQINGITPLKVLSNLKKITSL